MTNNATTPFTHTICLTISDKDNTPQHFTYDFTPFQNSKERVRSFVIMLLTAKEQEIHEAAQSQPWYDGSDSITQTFKNIVGTLTNTLIETYDPTKSVNSVYISREKAILWELGLNLNFTLSIENNTHKETTMGLFNDPELLGKETDKDVNVMLSQFFVSFVKELNGEMERDYLTVLMQSIYGLLNTCGEQHHYYFKISEHSHCKVDRVLDNAIVHLELYSKENSKFYDVNIAVRGSVVTVYNELYHRHDTFYRFLPKELAQTILDPFNGK